MIQKRKFQFAGGKINEDGAEFIINPYDEYAIEEAIQVRDAKGGEVTVISVGSEESEKQLRTALAMGADKAVLINTEDDVENGDQFTTAKIIAEYLKDKDADLILAEMLRLTADQDKLVHVLQNCWIFLM